MKCLLVICDGMADRPLEALSGRTPLEAANTKHLDAIAKGGICGIVDTIAPGIRPGSDTAHLAILGYDPYKYYTGRGPFETAGVGLGVKPGEIALRCNFATVDDAGIVVDRRADRISEGTDELASAINNMTVPGVNFRFKESTGHRGALVLMGEEFSDKITDSDPHKDGVKVREVDALDDSALTHGTAASLNSFIEESQKVLKAHPVNLKRIQEGKRPANILLLRGAGVAPKLVPFGEKYGVKAGCIATMALVRGVSRFCGLEVLGADPGASISELGSMALDAMDEFDFVLLNIKAADDATHDGNTQKKVEAIEEIDSVVAGFHEIAQKNYLAILSDHTSSITQKNHTGDPVPVVIAGPEVRSDDVSTFSERAAANGGLGRIRGQDIMNILIDLMNRSEKFGA
jgi:2,3-bisphosphoglycerate-independent phosphoglycerate mutase